MAIALDTSVNGLTALGTSLSWSHTCTGSNLLLWVGVVGAVSDVLTGVTYGSRNCFFVSKVQVPSGGRWRYLYALIGPAPGTDTITATLSASALVEGFSASYTGCAQGGVPDSSAAPFAAAVSSGADFSAGISTVEDDCWAIELFGSSTISTVTLSAGGTIRQQGSGLGGGNGIADSSAVIHPAGVHSFVQHKTGLADWAAVVASFAPYVAPPPPPPSTDGANITINDVNWSDRYSAAEGEGPQFTSQINARGTATVKINITPGELRTIPVVGMDLRIFDDGAPVFSGGIDNIEEHWYAESDTKYLILSCVSLEQRLDKLQISPRGYTGWTCGAIFADLLATTGGQEGISPGDIRDGPTVNRAYAWDSLTDAFDDLAQTSGGFYWAVNPDTFAADFRPRDANAAPFTLLTQHILWESIGTVTSREDLRTEQRIRLSQDTFALDTSFPAGDDVLTSFDVLRPIETIKTAIPITGGGVGQSPNSDASTGYFPSAAPNLSDGDTYSLGGYYPDTTGQITYTFKTAIDNTVPFQVLIGATLPETAINFQFAVNDSKGGDEGVRYSLPTWAHPDMIMVASPSGDGYKFVAKQPGFAGNFLMIQGGSAFNPAGGPGADGTRGQAYRVAVDGTGSQADIYFVPGSKTVRLAQPLPAGISLLIEYRALGVDVLSVRNDTAVAARAAIEGTSGRYDLMIDATGVTEPYSGIATANGALALYDEVGQVLTFKTRKPGLMAGQLLTLALLAPFDSLNGDWLIEEINAQYYERELHFEYSVRAIAAGKIGTALQFWQQLAINAGGSGSAGVGGSGGGSAGEGDPMLKHTFRVIQKPAGSRSGMDLTETPGVSGSRLSMQAVAIDGSAEFELVPGPNATGLTSEVMLFNHPGTNYERFTMFTVNDQFGFDTTSDNAGIPRNIYWQAGGHAYLADSFSIAGAAMTSGSTTLTISSGGFTRAHVNVAVAVPGAGVAGATLYSSVRSWTDSNHVVLWDAAATSVAGVTLAFTAGQRTVTDGQVSNAGGTALQSATAHFTQVDVGKYITVTGAIVSGTLLTRIVSVTDAVHATMADPATINNPAATVVIGLPVAGRSAITVNGSDASVDLIGSTWTDPASGNVFGATTTRIADLFDTGIAVLHIAARTTTPADVATDSMQLRFERGNTIKWIIGSNLSGSNTDRFEWYWGPDNRLPVIVDKDGNLSISGYLTTGDITDTGVGKITIDTHTHSGASVTTDQAYIVYQRGGASKWAAGLNASSSNADSYDWYSFAAGLVACKMFPGYTQFPAIQLLGAIVDPGDTGTTGPMLDTRTTTPTSNTADGSYWRYARGGSNKWAAGLNSAGSNVDSFDFYSYSSGTAPMRLTPTGAIVNDLAVNGTLTYAGLGTVTHTAGALTLDLPVVGNGAADIKVVSQLGVSVGGTGATSLTSHGVLIGQGTSAVAATSAGTAGHVLTSNGASADPTFQPAASGGLNQLTGDVTAGPGSGSQTATLATSGVSAATYGDATHVAQVTFDAKGRATAASNVAIATALESYVAESSAALTLTTSWQTPTGGSITVANAGTYLITISVTFSYVNGDGNLQLGLSVNGSLQSVSTVGSTSGFNAVIPASSTWLVVSVGAGQSVGIVASKASGANGSLMYYPARITAVRTGP